VTFFLDGDKMTMDMPLFFRKYLKISFNIIEKEDKIMAKIIKKSEAEKRAMEFYDDNFNIDNEIFVGNFATNLSYILQKLNIKVIIKSLAESQALAGGRLISGALLKKGDNYTIFVEEAEAKERKRFTIAHEIAHKILNHIDTDEHVSISFRGKGFPIGDTDEDTAANAFAAALLMPERMIRHVYKLTSNVLTTARLMGVSESAARYRLNTLKVL